MIDPEALVGSAAFAEEKQTTQCEMMLWALSSRSPTGVEIGEVCSKFTELGLFRPNPTRVKDAFKQSRNVRTVTRGRYAPTRDWAKSMDARFTTARIELTAAFDAADIPLPPFVSEERRRDLVRMISVYAHLFLLENSMRGLIEKVLSETLGANWWEQAANSAMKRKNADRVQNETVKKWAPTRSAFGPLYSLDWPDLITIIRKYEALFLPFIGEISFLHRFEDAGIFRNVVAHNGALRDEDDFALVGIDYRTWLKQLS